jgi:hypothetical protein
MGWLMFSIALGLTAAIQGGQYFAPIVHTIIIIALAVVSAVTLRFLPKKAVVGRASTKEAPLKTADLEKSFEGRG